TRKGRIEGLYSRDEQMTLRCSHENPEIKKLYEEFYGTPLSRLAEKMLHTSHISRAEDLTKHGKEQGTEERNEENTMTKWKCKICGYIYEGETLPEDFVRSEERRVGTECRSRGGTSDEEKKREARE